MAAGTSSTHASGHASRRRAVRLLSLAALLVAAGLAGGLTAPTPARAQTLDSVFSVDWGAAYTAKTRVTIGDGGWSPFFHPGVMVWDGGSILGGVRQLERFSPAARTLELLPYTVRSFLSITHGARIAGMTAEAPYQVDVLVDPDADANVCVAMPGGNDIAKDDIPVDALFDAVRQYCEGRRAAGFKVVLVTLLPRLTPATFETDRRRYNDLCRAQWDEFADGLADIGGDPRIGDDLDYLDLKYYNPDGVHPNAEGCAVIADVIAPVASSLSWRSDECELRFRNEGGAWTEWHDYAAASNWQLEPVDGLRTVEAEYRYAAETVALADSIALDTAGPRTYALREAVVRRGRAVSLHYRVNDPIPGSPKAIVTILVRASDGHVAKRLYLGMKPVARDLSVRFVCRLAKGTYRYVVYARDAAGNTQTRLGRRLLTVK